MVLQLMVNSNTCLKMLISSIADNHKAHTQIMELQQQIMELQTENVGLRQQIMELQTDLAQANGCVMIHGGSEAGSSLLLPEQVVRMVRH